MSHLQTHIKNYLEYISPTGNIIILQNDGYVSYLNLIFCHANGLPAVIVETKRCYIRELTKKDVPILYEILNEKEVVVGYDNRLTSKGLAQEVIKGLISTGINVYNIGLVTTPMLYFTRINYNIPLGIMITASHNPKEYNGFKFSFSKEGNAYGKQIEEFYNYTKEKKFKQGIGILEDKDIKDNYINNMLKSLNFGSKKIKAVFDCGNGTASVILKDIISKIDIIEPHYIYCESDGNFPNHHPDPSVSTNMVDLQKKVIELSCDIGVAFDGDADRVGVVDEKGNIVKIDILMAIIYNYLNNNLTRRNALFDVKCSKTLTDELKKLKIKETMDRTGASYTNMMMQTGNFDFGGEYSGHLFFKDRYQGFDDGIYAGLRIIEILSNNNVLSDLYKNYNKYYSTEELFIDIKEENKKQTIEYIKNYKSQKNATIIFVSHVMEEAAYLSDKILIMHLGKQVSFGDSKEIFKQSKKLLELGLDIPDASKIINKINFSHSLRSYFSKYVRRNPNSFSISPSVPMVILK